ncbi:MAG TPA: prolyl oligopeptidase family serine peptidase [Verrucomicrobiae bacterium]|jgi:dienelactone hydrolase|nr:prolyl oligopeptidase family serine peptidase [Verrucomicrobiae bacterium]
MKISALMVFLAGAIVFGDGPSDNIVDQVRPVPPPGLPIPEADRADLTAGLEKLRGEINRIAGQTNRGSLRTLLPDVQIFYNAVDFALRYNEFLRGTNDVRNATKLLEQGLERVGELEAGKASWTNATGLVVRGYLSKIDGSVQPYGLIVPASYANDFERPRRLDTWFHGRSEDLTELRFLIDREQNYGQFTPPDAFVLHLYGRYCNANKFAGEIDLFEAVADVKKHYRVDDDRIIERGFSMGGAAAWQFAVHYPGEFAAAAPGAGFAETKEFLRIFQNEPVAPPPWEQKLWHWYDCTDYALNLYNLPTVAYSGEIDRQKQAADVMAAALKKEGIELTHIIGPGAGHTYITKQHDARPEINEKIDAIAARGRDPLPKSVKFTTWTLRYNKSHWVELDGLEEHWERARIDAELSDKGIQATTKNVSALTFDIGPGKSSFAQTPEVALDGQTISGAPPQSDHSWRAHFRKSEGKWQMVSEADYRNHGETLAKRPGLQGPIDDAFMDSFVMVLPSGSAMNEKAGAWTKQEQEHAIREWRRQFRGEARLVKDTDLTTNEIATANLVLWGDPSSNEVLRKIAEKLPIKWSPDGLQLGSEKFTLNDHVPAFIYPNPLNPERYVVVNSGFTYREYDYLNNARQVAKLPDYAIIDISTPPNSRYPGKIVTGGFFDETWQVKKQ